MRKSHQGRAYHGASRLCFAFGRSIRQWRFFWTAMQQKTPNKFSGVEPMREQQSKRSLMPYKLIVFSGAGLSAESGLATFRDNHSGIWANNNLDEICNIHKAVSNKKAIFEFYNGLLEKYKEAQPNEAHQILARLQQKHGTHKVKLITQNVDTLLEQAGALEVMHLHGDMGGYNCLRCNRSYDLPKGQTYFKESDSCIFCASSKLKPRVVFFGERAPKYHDLYLLKESLTLQDMTLSIGTSWQVITPDMLISESRRGINNIQINPNPDYVGYFSENIAKPAQEALRQLEQRLDEFLSQ